jgi:crotonobetainyl-CoA:carnitine CoA-transferase CaiB-like acyl-CoA transferase
VLSLSVLPEDSFWRELCDLLGLKQYAHLNFTERAAKTAPLRAEIARCITTQPLAYWAHELDRRRIAWSPVLTLEEVTCDPHMIERELFAEGQDATGEAFKFVRQPLKFSNYINAVPGSVPPLGEGNDELLVLSEISK